MENRLWRENRINIMREKRSSRESQILEEIELPVELLMYIFLMGDSWVAQW